MDASFIPVKVTPSKTPTGLDQLRRSYKTALSAQDAIAAAPALYDPDEEYPNMFLMEVSTPESAESATQIDLVYMGSIDGTGETLVPIQVELSKTPTGLDQLRRTYKTTLSADDALAAAPAIGTADAVYANMFLTRVSVPESPEVPTRIDLVYMGSIEGDGSALVLIEVVPSKPTFGLDQLHRRYKTTLSAEDALALVPAIGSPDDVYATMFLTQVNVSRSPEIPTQVDLFYVGTFTGTLPAGKNANENSVQTATTFTSSAIFPAVATVPASLEYHAPTTSLIEFSDSDTSATDPPDPPAITVDDLISWTLAATQPASSFPDIAAWLLSDAFVQKIVATESAEEIVPVAQYFQITKRKTMQLFPYAPP